MPLIIRPKTIVCSFINIGLLFTNPNRLKTWYYLKTRYYNIVKVIGIILIVISLLLAYCIKST